MSNKLTEQGWSKFLRLCRGAHSEQELDEILQLLFTVEEQQHVATRILIIQELLKAAKTQREIAKDLNISIAKITRGSNNLKTIERRLKNYLTQQLDS